MNNNQFLTVIDNQAELIKKLKEENVLLRTNSRKFKESHRILKEHDYYVICSIDPLKVLSVKNVPSDGLLGYTKNEFVNNSFNWTDAKMFRKRDVKKIDVEHQERISYALDLGLEHFDIRLNIPFICKDKTYSWAYYVSFYDMMINEVKMYVRFLPPINDFILN